MSFHFCPWSHPFMLLNIRFQLPALCLWPGKWSPLDQRQLKQAPERQPLAQCHNLAGHQQPSHCQDWYQGHHADDHRSQKPGPEGCVGIGNFFFSDFIKLGQQWPRGGRSRFVTERLYQQDKPWGDGVKKQCLALTHYLHWGAPWAMNSTPICSVAITNAVHVEQGVHRKDNLCLADQPWIKVIWNNYQLTIKAFEYLEEYWHN